MSEIYDPEHWKTKDSILASATNAQRIFNIDSLLELSRISKGNYECFKKLGKEREARICQLRAELFAARVEELQLPKCSICGDILYVRYDPKGDTLCDSCWDWGRC